MTIRTITYDDAEWQVVPKRPTEDMLLRGYDTLMAWDARTGEDIGMRDMFLAMLAAAPEPPAQGPTMPDRYRQALEGLRERCAQEAERITARRRAVAALSNNEAVKPCEVAAAIRKIDVQQYCECAAMEIERLDRIGKGDSK